MTVIFLLSVLSIPSGISTGGFSFDMQCPHSSHWNYRGYHFCNNSTNNYICLFDANGDVYKETCGKDGPEQQRTGYKVVIRGGLDKEECGKDRFQPFKFLTRGNSDCSLLKSKCSEDGQIVHSEGSSTSNRLCGCDFLKGYVFVTLPIRTCFCDPEIEDCSCHIKQCPKGYHLSPDYRCLSHAERVENIDCLDVQRIDDANVKTTHVVLINGEDPDADLLTRDDLTKDIIDGAKVIVIVTCVFIIIATFIICLARYRLKITIEDVTKQKNQDTHTADLDDSQSQNVRKDIVTNTEKLDTHIAKVKDNQPQNVQKELLSYIRQCKEEGILINLSEEAKQDLKKTFQFERNNTKTESIDSELRILVFSHACYLLLNTFNTYIECPKQYILCMLDDIKRNYRKEDDCRMCVLLLILVCENKFETKWFDQRNEENVFKNRIKSICTLCEIDIEKGENKTKVKNAFRELENTLIEFDEIYSIHPALYRTVVVKCSDLSFRLVLEFIEIELVAECYKFNDTNSDMSCDIVVITQDEQLYLERLVDDLRSGKGYSFFHNSNLSNNYYRKKFIQFCRKRKVDVMSALQCYKTKSKDIKGVCIEEVIDSNLKEQKQRNCLNLKINLPLIDCILEGYFDIFELMVELECDVNEKDENDRSVLYYATLLSEQKCVELLLSIGANVTQADKHGHTVLHAACSKGATKTIDLLLKQSINLLNMTDSMGQTPLHIALETRHLSVAEKLLERDADVNFQNSAGQTALHLAAKGNSIQIVKDLLEKNAYPSITDRDGWTPLFVACYHRTNNIVLVLLQNDKHLLKDKDKDGQTPLYIASRDGNSKIVEILMQSGADPSIQNRYGKLPLQCACDGNHYRTAKALMKNNLVVNLKEDSDHRSPLHAACKRGADEIVLALLNKGADVNLQNSKFQTPLFVSMEERREQTINLLLQKGNSSTNICDENDTSPLNRASKSGLKDIVPILLEYGADILHCDNEKNSSLHFACREGFFEIAKMLIDKGACVNAINESGETPLFMACREGHVDIVKVLLENKADITISNDSDAKPRDIVKKGCDEIHEIIDNYTENYAIT